MPESFKIVYRITLAKVARVVDQTLLAGTDHLAPADTQDGHNILIQDTKLEEVDHKNYHQDLQGVVTEDIEIIGLILIRDRNPNLDRVHTITYGDAVTRPLSS